MPQRQLVAALLPGAGRPQRFWVCKPFATSVRRGEPGIVRSGSLALRPLESGSGFAVRH